NRPLYHFVGDAQPGDANGDGLSSFGAGWQAAGPAGPAAGMQPYGMPQMGAPQFGPPPAGGPSAPRTTNPYMGPVPQAPPNQGLQPAPYSAGFAQQPPPGYPYAAPGYTQGYSQTVTVVGPPTGFIYLNWLASPGADSYRIYRTLASAPMNFSVSQ